MSESIHRPWLAHYPKGVPAEIDLDEFPSIVALLDNCFDRFRHRPAYTNMGRTISYGYDSGGNRTELSTGRQRIEYQYDALSRLRQVVARHKRDRYCAQAIDIGTINGFGNHTFTNFSFMRRGYGPAFLPGCPVGRTPWKGSGEMQMHDHGPVSALSRIFNGTMFPCNGGP